MSSGSRSSDIDHGHPGPGRGLATRTAVLAVVNALMLLALAVAVAAWLETASDIEIEVELRESRVAAVLIGSIAFALASAWAWQRVLVACVGRSVRFRFCLSHTAMLLMGKYLPGKVWGLALRAAASRAAGVTIAEIAAASVLEQLLTLGCACLVGLSAFAFTVNPLAGMVMFAITPFVGAATVRLARPLGAVLPRWIRSRLEGLEEALQRATWADSVTLSVMLVANWFLLTFVLASVAALVGVDLGVREGALVLGAYSLAVVAGFLALFAPGGIGVREGLFVALAGPSLGYDVATTLAVVFRAWNVAFDILVGAAGLLVGLTNGRSLRD